MNASQIKEHSAVYAEGPGGLEGSSDVYIGTVDKVEGSKYIKLTKQNSPDGQHHWFPIEWIRAVDEQAVFLNKTAEAALSEMMNEQPTEG